jgi:hypothetical protein
MLRRSLGIDCIGGECETPVGDFQDLKVQNMNTSVFTRKMNFGYLLISPCGK